MQIKGVAIGAKFAPSVANLYMAKWEEEGILYSMYKRFIDDLLHIWWGGAEDMETLLHSMNDNDQNISLTWDVSSENCTILGMFRDKGYRADVLS